MASHNTIYLTAAEDERIRKTFSFKFQKCQELVGQPRLQTDSRSLLDQVTYASLMADMGVASGSTDRDTVTALAIGLPYPPCFVLLENLNPIGLSDLHMGSHHLGRALYIRRTAPVVNLKLGSWTIVEDEMSRQLERLEISLHTSRFGQDILDSATLFLIKEPYFTLSDQGEPTLRIDHPSDLVTREDHSSSGETTLSPSSKSLTLRHAAMKCKMEGNAALKAQDFPQALEMYTQGLYSISKCSVAQDDLAFDLFRNRSYVNLLLGRFDEARADALASLTGLDDEEHKILDSKAYFRAGQAAYNLGEFQDAKRFFEHEQQLRPSDKAVVKRLIKVGLRLEEQATGLYDFKKLKERLSKANPRVDAASFISNVIVGDSPGRGRGLFATHRLDVSHIVVCEKAFCVTWGHEKEALTAMMYDARDQKLRMTPAGLQNAIMQKLQNNPSQVERVMDLACQYSGIGKKLEMTESGPLIDAFQLHDIVSHTAFGPEPICGSPSDASAGLWITSSYANHSCIPNMKKESIGDLLVFRATRPIEAGEELTHSYDENTDHDQRSKALMEIWGFECTCALCMAEKTDDLDLRKRRRELEGEAHEFIERVPAYGASRISIVKARQLAKSINETYSDAKYTNLPRMAAVEIEKWLSTATSRS